MYDHIDSKIGLGEKGIRFTDIWKQIQIEEDKQLAKYR